MKKQGTFIYYQFFLIVASCFGELLYQFDNRCTDLYIDVYIGKIVFRFDFSISCSFDKNTEGEFENCASTL